MKNILFIISIFLLASCSKTKTVLICGDHVCINKKEAEQYFEDNLSLEVKIIDKKKQNKIDLVELNLKTNENNVKKVSITEKKETNKNIKILSNNEIKEKKMELKKREKIAKLENLKKKKTKVLKDKIEKNKEIKLIKVRKTKDKSEKQIVDVCTILEKCNIEEISKYLIEIGKKKGFPDITLRE
tara:strand:+ start:206 stop:760 length:555 start_codon:yes stop_codon:yes gene_type:complete